MHRCSKCKQDLPDDSFWNGVSYCKPCAITYRQGVRDATREWLKADKTEKGCILCGSHPPESLDYHHVDPESKTMNPNSLLNYSVGRAKKEIAKCVVLCANHHRQVHSGRIDLYEAVDPVDKVIVRNAGNAL